MSNTQPPYGAPQYQQQPYVPQHQAQQPRGPQDGQQKKAEPTQRRWVPWAGGIMIGLAVGLIIGATGSADTTTTAASTTPGKPAVTTTVTATPEAPATEAPETTEPPAPTYGTPKAADFKLAVKTLKKQCFGSAGCVLTYRIDVTYNGPALDPSTDYTVTYAVKGGEDPASNTFTVTGTDYTYDDKEVIQTSSSGAKLTAVVTDIF